MRKYLALTAVSMLLIVGCTSGNTEPDAGSDGSGTVSTDGKTSTTLDPEEVGRAPGVTDDTIRVGITYIDFEAIKDLTEIRHGDYEGAYASLIDEINEKGGIGGRKLEPVFGPVSPVGTDSADAACLKLTQDEQVFVVLGFFQADTVLCVVERNQTAVIGGNMTGERLDRAKAPWFTTEAGGDLDQDAIRKLAEEGELEGKLGVVATTQGEAALREDAEPLLDELGVDPVEVAIIDAPENDVAAQNSAVQIIAERFRSAGVEKVLAYGQSGLTWANGAAALDYRPQLLFTGLDAITAYTEDDAKDVELLDSAVGVGPLEQKVTSFSGEEAECIKTVEERTGEDILTEVEADEKEVPQNFIAPAVACRNLAHLRAIVEAAGTDLNYATFRQAGEGLGEIELPRGGITYTFGPPPSADGDPPVYLYDWNPAEREFVNRD